MSRLAQRRGVVPDAHRRCSRHAEPRRARGCMQDCGLDRAGAEQVVDYVVTGRAVLGAVPTHEHASSPSGSSTRAAACSS